MNWKKKLSSRKFWAGVVGFITPILILLNVPESEIVTISALVSSCGTLVAYIISEGYVDAMHSEEMTENDN